MLDEKMPRYVVPDLTDFKVEQQITFPFFFLLILLNLIEKNA